MKFKKSFFALMMTSLMLLSTQLAGADGWAISFGNHAHRGYGWGAGFSEHGHYGRGRSWGHHRRLHGNYLRLYTHWPVYPQRVEIIQNETVVINIPNDNGSYTPVSLRRSGGSYIGPRGEYYMTMPTVEQLKMAYGLK